MIDNTILNTKETSVDLADIIREGIADFTAKYG